MARNEEDSPKIKARQPSTSCGPWAEVHAHLEGCFEGSLLEQWANKFGEPMARPREHQFRFEGPAGLLHFLDWACGLVRSHDELAEAAYAFSQRLAAPRACPDAS